MHEGWVENEKRPVAGPCVRPAIIAGMAELSSARRRGFRWGWWSAALTHLGGSAVRKNRTVNALASATQVTLRSASKVGHLLWLEVTGLFFVFFAVAGAFAAWHDYSRHKTLSSRFAAALCFTIIFAWFGVSSFLRARRKA